MSAPETTLDAIDTLDTLEEATEVTYEGPVCEKCDAPLAPEQMVCRRCGYYPSMGMFVDLDDEWEAAVDPEAAELKQSRTALEDLSTAIPPWGWVIIGANLAIIAVSVLVRVALPTESVLYSFWGVWQLVIGLSLTAVLHVLCFIMIASDDFDMGILDLVVSPLKAWIRTCKRLPKRLWLVCGATGGVVAAICAALIIGGIQWDRLWDWNIKQPTKSSLVDAITSAAGNGPANEDGLEEAVADFAGQAGEMNNGKPQKPKKPEPPKPLKSADCLILGYNLDDQEQIKHLLIATNSSGRLVYAGQIVPEMPPEDMQALRNRLMRSHAGRPFVATGREAAWVRPRFPCRISYTEQAANGRLLEMKWEELLDELDLPW